MKYCLTSKDGTYYVTCSEQPEEKEHQVIYDSPSELGRFLRDKSILESIRHLSIKFKGVPKKGLSAILDQFPSINGSRASNHIDTDHYTLDIFSKR